jgi:hypothetical protein
MSEQITYATARWNGRETVIEIRKGDEKIVFRAQGGASIDHQEKDRE